MTEKEHDHAANPLLPPDMLNAMKQINDTDSASALRSISLSPLSVGMRPNMPPNFVLRTSS